MVSAICHELQLRSSYLHHEPINTVYFGGGTPTILNGEQFTLIFETIKAEFELAKNVETTVEANPDDINPEKLHLLRDLSVNRFSLGVQSFNDKTLEFLNRVHSSEIARRSIEEIKKAGFKNFSIDLMYSIPGQTESEVENCIDELIALSPQHISAYSLTIEEKTVFGRWHKSKKLETIDDEISVREFGLLMDKLTAAGFEHYEISNFAKPGFHSGHNTSYWKGEKYIGVGPSAHSYDGASRQWNVSNNVRYMKSIDDGKVPFEIEVLTRENKINEFLLTTLRTMWGCDLRLLRENFNYDLMSQKGDYINSLIDKGLVELKHDVLRLLRSGKFVADKIALDLFLEV